jgi:hypothetical protein
MQISILKGSTDGNPVYAETQTPTSNSNGLVSVEIGSGTIVSGDFSAIDWSVDTYFIKTEIDPTGGTDYSITGISQLLSVPYALYAKTAGNAFSGDFNDLKNKPEVFNGSFSGLTDIPSGLSDGDDNTQLNEAQVDTFVANNGYLTVEVDGSITNEIQDLELTGNSLKITNNAAATSIDLSAYLNGADTKLSESEVDAFVANNGYLTTEVDGSVTNEIQDLQLSGNILTITKNGSATSIDLSAYLTDTDTKLSESEVDAFVANNGYLTTEVDGSTTNEIQDLSLNGNNLTITGNGTATTIDLSSYLDNTNLSEAQVDAFVANNGYLIAEVDGSTTNEIQNLRLIGNSLKITNNGSATTIDLSPYLDDTDTKLTEAEVDDFVANNGYLTAELDGSITNEIQNLQLIGNSLKITNNGLATTIDLSPYLDDTDTKLTEAEVDDFVANNGYLTAEVDGSVTNELELPSQFGHAGEYLTTNGSSQSWAPVAGVTITNISANTTLSVGDQIVFINGAFTATFPASPTDGMKLNVGSDNQSAGVYANGKNIYIANSTFSSLLFSTGPTNLYTFYYSAAIDAWVANF